MSANKALSYPTFSNVVIADMRQICESLVHRGISIFKYARVLDDGSCYILSNRPEVETFLFDRKIQITANVPSHFLRERFWYLVPSSGLYFEPLRALKNDFKIGSIVDYIERFDGYYDMYCFGSNLEDSQAATLYLNERDFLSDFICSFKEKARKVTKESHLKRIQLDPRMLPSFKGLSRKNEGLTFGKERLTSREWDCARYLMLGYTAKETGLQLDISPRTVEMYLENLKLKLGSTKRSETIRILRTRFETHHLHSKNLR